jgi:4,5-DOPA dioxygenase extradiol
MFLTNYDQKHKALYTYSNICLYFSTVKRSRFLKLTGLTSLYCMTKPLQELHQIQNHLKESPKMPVLFLGHGSPMNAIEENIFVQGFKKIALQLPIPQAILCISAHWYTRGTFITYQEQPSTIHDFGGFPKALFEVQYPAKGHPALAEEVKELIQPQLGVLDQNWGYDHGSWSVVKHLYPQAEIPMIQMSIDQNMSPLGHYELASQLQSLRKKGVLIIGSGNIIHNLSMVDFTKINEVDYGYDWAQEAHPLFNQWIRERNIQKLCNLPQNRQAIQLSIPTAEHYLPLLYTMGLQDKNEEPLFFNDHLIAGSLSMTSIRFGNEI